MRKTITIKRRANSTNLPDHVYEGAKKRIGATYTKSGDVNTGLSLTEMKELMPVIVNVSSDDMSFFKTVKNWFFDLSIDVPPAGVDLEVGVDKKGNPYNVMEYVKYKFALVHPYVVNDIHNASEVRKKRKFVFHIEDKGKEKQLKIAAKDSRKQALTSWIKLTSDEDKMDQVLRVFGEFPDNMDKDDKELRLESLAKENSTKFLKIVEDKNLTMQATIREFLSHEVLRKVGNTYFNGDEAIGVGEEEVIAHLNDKSNSDLLVTLKAKLGEFTKK